MIQTSLPMTMVTVIKVTSLS